MENKHKNALIGALLAIVFIMAVGFAGFTQQLKITDSTSVDSSWNIGFESVTPNHTCTESESYCGEIAGFNAGDKILNLNTKLSSPSDQIIYTVVIKNYGSVDAKIADNGIIMDTTNKDSVLTYTQNGLSEGTTVAAGKTISFTITVTFPQQDGTIDATKLTNGLNMYIDWVQV
jgi:uncharacterized repeat protein (TIGR01451 family)